MLLETYYLSVVNPAFRRVISQIIQLQVRDMPSLQRHFTFKHPLFRARKSSTGVWWENSVYYLWWEFLRRHDGDKRTCENGDTGQYAKLYADFGDVHSGNFREWWMKDDRGARLFAEPALPNSVTSISPSDIDESLSEAWKSGALLVIAIPLALRKRFISQKINKLLKQKHHRRRGQRTFKESRALYRSPVSTTLAACKLHSPHMIFETRNITPNCGR